MKRAAGLACSPASGTTVASFSTIYLLLSFAFPVEQTLGWASLALPSTPNNSSPPIMLLFPLSRRDEYPCAFDTGDSQAIPYVTLSLLSDTVRAFHDEIHERMVFSYRSVLSQDRALALSAYGLLQLHGLRVLRIVEAE